MTQMDILGCGHVFTRHQPCPYCKERRGTEGLRLFFHLINQTLLDFRVAEVFTRSIMAVTNMSLKLLIDTESHRVLFTFSAFHSELLFLFTKSKQRWAALETFTMALKI